MTDQRRGLLLGVAAYGLWGGFPLYWPHLEPAGAIEILAHRVLWSVITMGLLVLLLRRTRQFRALFSQRRTFVLLAVAAFVITFNWATYIYGVNNGKVVETSLGYFINPLVTVLMGVFILGERLRPLQWVRHGGRNRRRRGADRRLRPAAVGGAGAGVLVRHLRAGQEVRERRRRREPHPRDDPHRAVRGGVHRPARGHRPLQLRLPRRRPRAVAHHRPAS